MRGAAPWRVEAFAGNTADPATVEVQIEKLRTRFGLADVVLVGDGGMLTSARIERLREIGGIGWVSCLRAPAIRALVEAGDLQLSLFDERNLAQITSPQFRGERLVVCRNPALAVERARKREALLVATEKALGTVAGMVGRGSLRTAAAIGLRAGRVVDAKKMAKHFELTIADGVFAFERRGTSIAQEAALDGLYVVRTSVSAERLDTSAVVETYKRLALVERAFRGLKSVELAVRPIFHRTPQLSEPTSCSDLLAERWKFGLVAEQPEIVHRERAHTAQADADRDPGRAGRDRGRGEARLGPG
jgi:Transposase DDE domain